jgi:hypothetical protein
VRIASALLLILALTGCSRKTQNSDAVHQGVLDHLTKAGLNVKAMDVKMTSVRFEGNRADATVAITPKGTSGGGMSMTYHLEQQADQWVVVGRQDAGAPHGGGAMRPGMPNPHGGGMAGQAMPAVPASPGAMPAPEDLPPTGQKK